jgi:hypothetical protein
LQHGRVLEAGGDADFSPEQAGKIGAGNPCVAGSRLWQARHSSNSRAPLSSPSLEGSFLLRIGAMQERRGGKACDGGGGGKPAAIHDDAPSL